jgi:hypothetical protein
MREIGPRWIGSVTTIEMAFPIERPSAPQPSSTAQPRYPRRMRTSAIEFRSTKNAGAQGEAGIESEEGTAFESLPRRKPCRNTADQPFLLSINFESQFMPRWCFRCVLPRAKKETLFRWLCCRESSELFAKLDRSSGGAAADGSSGVLNDSGFCTSFDRRIEEALPRRSCLRVLVRRQDMTGAERSWASHYEIGDVEAVAFASVVAINPATNQLTVQKANQELATYDPRRLTGVSV